MPKYIIYPQAVPDRKIYNTHIQIKHVNTHIFLHFFFIIIIYFKEYCEIPIYININSDMSSIDCMLAIFI